ncbi:hypothetical protein D9758_010195 [Tetrapyrgos nigripes]|uniref:Uncharacterized protein n=1 Tax=Tetrapyrgos nigripes TaxID=182062 RepID=A0A8H5CZ27_9AGAR|nr:hypothetical protein D9758_010195 [Tetrapyrgos nigripes]
MHASQQPFGECIMMEVGDAMTVMTEEGGDHGDVDGYWNSDENLLRVSQWRLAVPDDAENPETNSDRDSRMDVDSGKKSDVETGSLDTDSQHQEVELSTRNFPQAPQHYNLTAGEGFNSLDNYATVVPSSSFYDPSPYVGNSFSQVRDAALGLPTGNEFSVSSSSYGSSGSSCSAGYANFRINLSDMLGCQGSGGPEEPDFSDSSSSFFVHSSGCDSSSVYRQAGPWTFSDSDSTGGYVVEERQECWQDKVAQESRVASNIDASMTDDSSSVRVNVLPEDPSMNPTAPVHFQSSIDSDAMLLKSLGSLPPALHWQPYRQYLNSSIGDENSCYSLYPSFPSPGVHEQLPSLPFSTAGSPPCGPATAPFPQEEPPPSMHWQYQDDRQYSNNLIDDENQSYSQRPPSPGVYEQLSSPPFSAASPPPRSPSPSSNISFSQEEPPPPMLRDPVPHQAAISPFSRFQYPLPLTAGQTLTQNTGSPAFLPSSRHDKISTRIQEDPAMFWGCNLWPFYTGIPILVVTDPDGNFSVPEFYEYNEQASSNTESDEDIEILSNDLDGQSSSTSGLYQDSSALPDSTDFEMVYDSEPLPLQHSYNCHVCNVRSFSRKEALERHLNTAHKAKNFKTQSRSKSAARSNRSQRMCKSNLLALERDHGNIARHQRTRGCMQERVELLERAYDLVNELSATLYQDNIESGLFSDPHSLDFFSLDSH